MKIAVSFSFPQIVRPRLASIFVRCGVWIVLGLAAPARSSAADASGIDAGDRPAPYAATSYGVEDGLPDPVAMTVLQTRDGFLWTGTDFGLARFDGSEFTTYRASSTPGLAYDRVRCLFEDSRSVLWIGTHNGVSLLRAGKFERVPNLDTPVTAVAEDRTGKIFVGTRNQGLFEYLGGVARAVDLGLRVPGRSQILALFGDSSGRLWIGLGLGAPVYLEGGQVRRVALETSGGGTPTFVEQPRGTIWFANGAALIRWRDGSLDRYGKNAGLSDDPIAGLCTDAAGRIWVTAGSHIYHTETAAAPVFVPVSVPALQQGRQIVVDREGNYWIGTSGYGLVKLRASAFQEISLPAQGEPRAGTIAIDGDGTVSLGLIPENVVRIASDGTPAIRIDTGMAPNDEVLTLLSSRDNRLWIGRHSSLLVWDRGKLTEFPSAQKIHSIYEDHAGAVWLGSESAGVLRWRDGVFERMNPLLQLRDGATAAAFAESEGALFIGLRNGGLVRLRGTEVTHYPANESTRVDIRALMPDRDGHLWIGTRGNGLGLFDGNQMRFSPRLSAPFEGLVSGIEVDDAGRLFVGGSRGIFWAARDAAVAALRGARTDNPFQRAAESEGLRPTIVGFGQLPASAKHHDGRLWFITHTGVVVVDPARIVSNPVMPPVHVLRASIGDRTIEIENDALVLPPDAAGLRIDYTAPMFARPDLVRFRYRLEREEPEWTEAGGRRFGVYNHLTPGQHHFRVIAANESGVWNEQGATLLIVQRPHFYQTLWFRLLVFSAFVLVTGIVARWWTRRNLQQRLNALEAEHRLQRERTRIARDLHDEIGGSVTKIGYLVDRLEMQNRDEATRQLQQQLSHQTRLLASDLDRVVWSVNSKNGALPQLANFIATFVQTFLRETSVRCSTRVSPGLPAVAVPPETQHHVLAVIKEAINNALKHARPSHIGVQVSADEKYFTVTIEDDGVGFDAGSQAHSERNGLCNMRARAAEIGGELTLLTAPGRGATVSLRIPLSTPCRP